jgi:nucleoside-diphosphate-sugar epimerase
MNKLPIVILQPAVVFGPGDNYNIFKLFKGIKEGKFVFIGNGENKLHFVYIKNLIDASILALKNKKAIGERFLIADEKPIKVKELVEVIANELNVKTPKLKIPKEIALLIAFMIELKSKLLKDNPLITRDGVKFLSSNHEYNISKAKRILGYRPKYTTVEGIKETLSTIELY